MALGPDPHSYANYLEAVVSHIDLDWDVDFTREQIHGTAKLTVRAVAGANPVQVLLDTRNLAISRVWDAVSGSDLQWTLPKHHAVLGQCLAVPLPAKGAADHWVLAVSYSTTSRSSGVQWFRAEQTFGKAAPFVYTQFQAILARTALPCQDTPAVKHTYSAVVTVPNGMVAVCSGAPQGEPENLPSGAVRHTFAQRLPIPAYLIALAAGRLGNRQLGPRAQVWCEPELLEQAATEFANAGKFLEAAEEVFGVPYRWEGPYGMVILPHAFPYGGMENPQCTFINASLVVGDRSQEVVVAHEIIHSWTGNLVTNATWRDFWLNEGFTRFAERHVLGKVFGQEVREFAIGVGYNILRTTVADLAGRPEHRKLRPDIEGEDPDDSFSRIPYEKGSLFLIYLERLVGGPEPFLKWLKTYILRFENGSLDSEQMRSHFTENFPEAAAKVDWNEWLDGPDLPAFNPTEGSSNPMAAQVQHLTDIWLKHAGNGATAKDLDWHPLQTLMFLDELLLASAESTPLPVVQNLVQLYPRLSTTPDPEVGCRVLRLRLRAKDVPAALEPTENFLGLHGRGLYVRALYNSLAALVRDGTIAATVPQGIYAQNRSRYHQCLHSTLDSLMANL
eukprot:TRINITY_DN2280_c0_g1_i1.p1 TRINITY_DN2280_c0_g1~~TRINITY_DN2280_c0_g1_i1.p1  ORF type:complete len:617 (-),score=117.23 TRINITY_DN2280_c0_g1_i1:13-1863(-)